MFLGHNRLSGDVTRHKTYEAELIVVYGMMADYAAHLETAGCGNVLLFAAVEQGSCFFFLLGMKKLLINLNTAQLRMN